MKTGQKAKRVPEREQAEDLVHDVIVKAHVHQTELKNPGRLRQWLFQITRNALVDFYRSRKPLEPLPEALVLAESEADRQDEKELSSCLLPLLQELPERYREPLRWADFEGMSQQAIADRLGLSLPGSKSRAQRARKMLREVLLRCCRVELDRRGGIAGYEALDQRDCATGAQGSLGSPCPTCRPSPTVP